MKILVSACLLGEKCRYDGRCSDVTNVSEFIKAHDVIGVCPEVAGGLPTPRLPAEIVGKYVLRNNGDDVTSEFINGAEISLKIAQSQDVDMAILKSKSPSCGIDTVYDGSFSKTLKAGNGIFAQKLLDIGIPCFTENSLSDKI
jgi:uncharacterized protein YbbK (DUF523 family)